MNGPKRNPGWEDQVQSGHALRKHRQPVAVYDLTTKKENPFFSYLGKFTVACVMCILAYVTVSWLIHRTSDRDAKSADADEPPEFAYTPISAQASPPAPKLGYVASWGITGTGAAISWSTDVPSNTSLSYGPTRSLGQVTPVEAKLDVTHGVKLSGLKNGTTYYFVAQSAGKDGVVGYSQICTFTTLGAVGTAPKITGIVVVPGANNKVDISWTTNVPTFSYVQIGTSATYDRYSTRTALTTNPHPSFSWVPSGTVHYQLVSTDAHENKTVSPDYTFVEP